MNHNGLIVIVRLRLLVVLKLREIPFKRLVKRVSLLDGVNYGLRQVRADGNRLATQVSDRRARRLCGLIWGVRRHDGLPELISWLTLLLPHLVLGLTWGGLIEIERHPRYKFGTVLVEDGVWVDEDWSAGVDGFEAVEIPRWAVDSLAQLHFGCGVCVDVEGRTILIVG